MPEIDLSEGKRNQLLQPLSYQPTGYRYKTKSPAAPAPMPVTFFDLEVSDAVAVGADPRADQGRQAKPPAVPVNPAPPSARSRRGGSTPTMSQRHNARMPYAVFIGGYAFMPLMRSPPPHPGVPCCVRLAPENAASPVLIHVIASLAASGSIYRCVAHNSGPVHARHSAVMISTFFGLISAYE